MSAEDPDQHLRKLVDTFSSLGDSRRAILQRLLPRYPYEQLRRVFSDIPDSEFPPPPAEPVRAAEPARAVTAAMHRTAAPVPIADMSQHLLGTLKQRAEAVSQTKSRELEYLKSLGVTAEEGISFQFVPLIQCSFPHGDPGDLSVFTRRNGWLELTLATNRPSLGLPYGVPARLLTIFLTSEAIRTRSPEIFLGESLHEFLRRLDVPITRGERGSLRVYADQLLRIISCSISVNENIQDASGRVGLQIRQALFAEEARLWWDDGAGVGRGSVVQLSTPLYHSLLERSAPLATAAIKALRKSPMDLDVYAWLVHRLFKLSSTSIVTWEQLSEQFGHGYRELRAFRRFFTDSLKRVLEVYREAKVKPGERGLMLMPSKPHVRPPKKLVSS